MHTICAKSGWYYRDTTFIRDADWYKIQIDKSQPYVVLESQEFLSAFSFSDITNPNCSSWGYDYNWIDSCHVQVFYPFAFIGDSLAIAILPDRWPADGIAREFDYRISFVGIRDELPRRTWNIHADGSGDAPTIAAAMDSALGRDTLIIHEGTYYEHDIALKPYVWIRGANGDPDSVVIDAQGLGQIFIASDVDSNTTVRDILFRNGFGFLGGGMSLENSSVVIKNCKFSSNEATNGGGLYIHGDSKPRVDSCAFEFNVATDSGGAIFIWADSLRYGSNYRYYRSGLYYGNSAQYGGAAFVKNSRGEFSHCVFDSNSASSGGAVHISSQDTTINNNNWDISSCTLTRNSADSGRGGAVFCDGGAGGYFTLSGSELIGNVALKVGGVALTDSRRGAVRSSIIAFNEAESGGGVFVDSTAEITLIDGCTIYENSAIEIGAGVAILSDAVPSIQNNIIAFNKFSEGIYFSDSTAPPNDFATRYNDIYANEGGDWIRGLADNYLQYGNFSEDPLLCDPDNGDFTLHAASPCYANYVGRSHTIGCGDPPRVWHIFPDGTGDAPTIAAGCDSAFYGDTIQIACGTYNEYDLELPRRVCIRSETRDPSCVTIDAQGLGRVFSASDITPFTTIEGITLSNGFSASGAGIYLLNSSPTLKSCAFTDNYADNGAAIHCDQASNPLIDSCTIVGNSALNGGGIRCVDASPIIMNTSFSDNDADNGGAIYCQDSSEILVSFCAFDSNTAYNGGAIQGWNAAQVSISNSIFTGNSAENGGAVRLHAGNSTVATSLFNGNSSNYGGAVCAQSGSQVDLRYCTLVSNSATASGAGVGSYGTGTSVNIENSIVVFGQVSEGVYCDVPGGASATLACTDLYNNDGGDWVGCIASQFGANGNISADPMFCEFDSGNYSLDVSSLCLNTPSCDSMGAFGAGCDVVTGLPSESGATPVQSVLHTNRPNPFNPTTTLQFNLSTDGHVRLLVHDVTGRHIATLEDGKISAGSYQKTWDGRDESGQAVASGIYFARLEAGGFTATRKMVLLR